MAYNLTTLDISAAVERSLRLKGWTVAECCNAYNNTYKNATLLRKDFVHRVRKNNFSVVSPRVIELCNFLGIDTPKKDFNYKLQKEIDAVELIVRRNPKIEGQVKNLLRDIVELAGV